MIEAVIFDFDGTLVRLPINYETLFDEFKRIIGIPEVRPIANTVSKLDRKTQNTVFEAWDKAELAVAGDIATIEEGAHIYKKYKEKKKGLVTLQGKAIIEAFLKLHNFTFEFVLTREDSLFRTEQLAKAIHLLNIKPENVLFVGNSDSDSFSAGEVGCQFHRVK